MSGPPGDPKQVQDWAKHRLKMKMDVGVPHTHHAAPIPFEKRSLEPPRRKRSYKFKVAKV